MTQETVAGHVVVADVHVMLEFTMALETAAGVGGMEGIVPVSSTGPTEHHDDGTAQ
jgi:hypothetical protein